jgi:hypothetical protein
VQSWHHPRLICYQSLNSFDSRIAEWGKLWQCLVHNRFLDMPYADRRHQSDAIPQSIERRACAPDWVAVNGGQPEWPFVQLAADTAIGCGAPCLTVGLTVSQLRLHNAVIRNLYASPRSCYNTPPDVDPVSSKSYAQPSRPRVCCLTQCDCSRNS